jgi:formate/nitrite transporter FocA (FNT family)
VITLVVAAASAIVMLRATWIHFASPFPTRSNVFVFLLGVFCGICVSAAMWVSSDFVTVFARGR